jgi:hypothetical protein
MRVGSSSVECTLFPPPSARHSSSKASSTGAGSIMSGGQNSAKGDVLQHFTMASAHNSSTAIGSSLFRSGRGRKGEFTRAGVEQSNALGMHGESTSVESRSAESDDHAAQLLSSLPSSDHALSYVVLDNGVRNNPIRLSPLFASADYLPPFCPSADYCGVFGHIRLRTLRDFPRNGRPAESVEICLFIIHIRIRIVALTCLSQLLLLLSVRQSRPVLPQTCCLAR